MKNKYYIVVAKLKNVEPAVVYCEWYEIKEEAEIALEEIKEKYPVCSSSSFIYSADKLNAEKEI